MSVKFDYKACNSCQGNEEPLCTKFCPGDLLAINEESKKPYIRSERDCWDCMVCVKACPFDAIETKLPYQLANYKASLQAKLSGDKIIWRLKDAKGNEEIFELKTSG